MTQRHHNFDNSMTAAEGYKVKRTRDDYDEAGSSNNEPHPKGLKDSQNLWLTVTQTMRSQASTKNVVKS